MIVLNPRVVRGLSGSRPDRDVVGRSLQLALELEHSTIPLYLYALYSLDGGVNAEIAQIIRSVVIEEMLHLTLVANVLNAIGGSPSLSHPRFLPNYPCRLPGGVESGLEIHLAPFSLDQLETFLDIEEPATAFDLGSSHEFGTGVTVGGFYTSLLGAIARLGESAFPDAPRNQVGPALMNSAVIVFDVTSAQEAIQTIIDQGEGTARSPLEVVGSGYAHYYRFKQIQRGHLLVPAAVVSGSSQDYDYAGPVVPFDRSGVFAVPRDPGPYEVGSPQALLNEKFNYDYTTLLRTLHRFFNGAATNETLRVALGLMSALEEQAKAMMSGGTGVAFGTGPTFQYQSRNPSK